MSLGALTFLSPWLLTGLIALPVIYWLLRTVPPRPRQIRFPATRILAGVRNKEKTPDKTPWWLMLIRLIAAALVIFALADPILNPDRGLAIKGKGPVALVVDNGWTAAAGWGERQAVLNRLVDQAAKTNRSVVLVTTAVGAISRQPLQPESPAQAQRRVAALTPLPFAPDRAAAAEDLAKAVQGQQGVDVIWISDGIDHGGSEAFAQRLSDLASAGLTVFEPGSGALAMGVSAGLGRQGRLVAKVITAGDARREGILHALSARGERLSEARFALDAGTSQIEADFDLPLELRNQVSRVALSGERSAGAVHLLDARSRWNRVGLISGANQEQAQPLLGPLYYIERALKPFAETVTPEPIGAAEAIRSALQQNASVLMLADIGVIGPDVLPRLAAWIEEGGVLVRFAGPRLERGGDELLPVRLRRGGRALGGALSWSQPQNLAEFGDNSPFVGLDVPDDVLIRRQVLSDPASTLGDAAVWARLSDGTPLVTARRMEQGRIVLFHVTANSDWSNLPLSGLFVEMLRRVTALSNSDASRSNGIVTAASASDEDSSALPQGDADVIAPQRTLDGFGALGTPPPTAEAAPLKDFATLEASARFPPGYYGADATSRALNVVSADSSLVAMSDLPASATRAAYGGETQTDLKPWLLMAALTVLFVDIVAVMLLQAGGIGALMAMRRSASSGASLVAMMAVSTMLEFAITPDANAQTAGAVPSSAKQAETKIDPSVALAATSNVTFAYVLTGDASIDATSKAGLDGLVTTLTRRTAVEPGPPFAVDIERDEISFFPIIYWPVTDDAQALSEAAAAKLDAYMKRGGMVIFDTRDFGQGVPLGFSRGSSRTGQTPLQRILSRLDIPRLQPVPENHVLTKSFYLINTFPGRWEGGKLWVEAISAGTGSGDGRKARRADGVSSILITANDFASAWAIDERGRPLFPVVPGGERQREWAYRTGINIAMYALTGNYKADQVHIPALLDRLGQ